jgi:alpha-ketoglutarate-dependent taurine dioxygenase
MIDDTLNWKQDGLLQYGSVKQGSELAKHAPAVVAWLQAHRQTLEARLAQTGAIILRGFALHSAQDFNACVPYLGEDAMRYDGGASPRGQIHGAVYESTQWPWFFRIRMHNEMSYLPAQPSRVAFFCAHAPIWGGATLVCDMAQVYKAIAPKVRERFERQGIRYVRYFSGTPKPWAKNLKRLLRDNMQQEWRTAFRTDDRAQVEVLCEQQGLRWAWTNADGLRVESVLPATRTHPHTGEPVWFNQSTTMHPNWRALGVVYPYLRLTCPDIERYPYNVMYGDGSPITTSDLASVYDATDQLTMAPKWQTGDLMLLDNRWMAHGRSVYLGHREIQVALMS